MKTPLKTFLILLVLAILLFFLQKTLLNRIRQSFQTQVPLLVQNHLSAEGFRLEESLRVFERTGHWLAELGSTRRLVARLGSETIRPGETASRAEELRDLAAAMSRPFGEEETAWLEIALLASDGRTLLRVGSGGAILPLADAPFDPIKQELGIASLTTGLAAGLTTGTAFRSPVLLVTGAAPVATPSAAPVATAPETAEQQDDPLAGGDSPDGLRERSEPERRAQYFGFPIASGGTILGFLLLGADLEATLAQVPASLEAVGGTTSVVTWAPSQCGFYLAHPRTDFILSPENNIFINLEGPLNLQEAASDICEANTAFTRFLPAKNPTHFAAAVRVRGCPWSLLTVVDLRSLLSVQDKVLDFALTLTLAALAGMIALGMAAFIVNADPAPEQPI